MDKVTSEVVKSQELLYIWISKLDKRSLASIKKNCEHLNEAMNLQFSNPMWGIFWPLVFNGVVDHIGNGYYALTNPIVLEYDTHSYYINAEPVSQSGKNVAVGITECVFKEEHKYKIMKPSAACILRAYPCIKDVVCNFPTTLQDESELCYKYKKKGLAELKNGLRKFFSIPKESYIRELPSRDINPEAYAIAYSLTRIVNNESNGSYNKAKKILLMPTFALPFMLYRALMLECMVSRKLPYRQHHQYVFENISLEIVKQLNRILCNSIRYE